MSPIFGENETPVEGSVTSWALAGAAVPTAAADSTRQARVRMRRILPPDPCEQPWSKIQLVEDLVLALTRFHRDVFVPDIERIVVASERRLRDEMRAGFEAPAQRLDRLAQVRTLEAGVEE